MRSVKKRSLPSLMSPEAAAERLGVCRMTVSKAMKLHKLGVTVASASNRRDRKALTPDDVMFLATQLQVGRGRPKAGEK
tara:strand:- start:38 stop:274 length:237 start_codon:yes stop_codon:yes gene_type:complete